MSTWWSAVAMGRCVALLAAHALAEFEKLVLLLALDRRQEGLFVGPIHNRPIANASKMCLKTYYHRRHFQGHTDWVSAAAVVELGKAAAELGKASDSGRLEVQVQEQKARVMRSSSEAAVTAAVECQPSAVERVAQHCSLSSDICCSALAAAVRRYPYRAYPCSVSTSCCLT